MTYPYNLTLPGTEEACEKDISWFNCCRMWLGGRTPDQQDVEFNPGVLSFKYMDSKPHAMQRKLSLKWAHHCLEILSRQQLPLNLIISSWKPQSRKRSCHPGGNATHCGADHLEGQSVPLKCFRFVTILWWKAGAQTEASSKEGNENYMGYGLRREDEPKAGITWLGKEEGRWW